MNPFWDMNCIKDPSKFVGRVDEVKLVTKKIFNLARPNSVAIRGEKFIGKRALMSYVAHLKNDIENVVFCPIWIDLLTFESATVEQFFAYFSEPLFDKLPTSNRLEQIYKKIEQAKEGKLQLFEIIQALTRIFNIAKAERLQVIYFIDNFETIAKVFHNREGAFASLRELISSPNSQIAIVTSTHETIWKLSRDTEGISKLAAGMTDLPLRLMSEQDIRQLIDTVLNETEIKFEENDFSFILRYSGCHPHFVQLLSGYLYEFKKKGGYDYNAVLNASHNRVYNDFEKMRNRLGNEKFNLLLSAENISAKGPELEELYELGHLIKENEHYKPFGLMYEGWLSTFKRRTNVENPYTVGKPVTGKKFYGRTREVRQILENISNNNYLIDAQWRMGKTSLLFKIQEELEVIQSTTSCLIPVYISIAAITEDAVWAKIVQAILEKLRRKFSIQGNDSEILLHSSNYDRIKLKYDLLGFVKEINEHLTKNRKNGKDQTVKFILFIDEAQQINSYTGRTRAELREFLSQDPMLNPHISSILAGYQIERLAGENSSPWTNFTQTFRLGELPDNEIISLITDPTKAMYHERFRFDSAAIDKILGYGRKLPYDTQVYCYHAFDEAVANRQSLITAEIVEKIKLHAGKQISEATSGLRG